MTLLFESSPISFLLTRRQIFSTCTKRNYCFTVYCMIATPLCAEQFPPCALIIMIFSLLANFTPPVSVHLVSHSPSNVSLYAVISAVIYIMWPVKASLVANSSISPPSFTFAPLARQFQGFGSPLLGLSPTYMYHYQEKGLDFVDLLLSSFHLNAPL